MRVEEAVRLAKAMEPAGITELHIVNGLHPTLLTTRGLAEEVRALLSRAREVGLDPDQLGALALR